MALSKNIEVVIANKTINFPNCYIKTSSVSGTKEEITALVNYFAENTKAIIKQKAFTFKPNMEGGNFIKQAYEHLKTLPEFAGAADV